MCGAIKLLLRCTIDRTVIMGSKTTDGLRREDVGLDDMAAEVRDEPDAGSNRRIIPTIFLLLILYFVEFVPSIGVCDGGQTNESCIEIPKLAGVFVIVW